MYNEVFIKPSPHYPFSNFSLSPHHLHFSTPTLGALFLNALSPLRAARMYRGVGPATVSLRRPIRGHISEEN